MSIEHADFDGIERLALVLGGEIVSTFDNPADVRVLGGQGARRCPGRGRQGARVMGYHCSRRKTPAAPCVLNVPFASPCAPRSSWAPAS